MAYHISCFANKRITEENSQVKWGVYMLTNHILRKFFLLIIYIYTSVDVYICIFSFI